MEPLYCYFVFNTLAIEFEVCTLMRLSISKLLWVSSFLTLSPIL